MPEHARPAAMRRLALASLLLVPLALAGGEELMAQGESRTQTFSAPGEFPYHCDPHPAMEGKILVREGAPLNATVAIRNHTFVPATVEVAPGGVVTWTNEDAEAHTATLGAPSEHGGRHSEHHEAPLGGIATLVAALVAGALLMRRAGT